MTSVPQNRIPRAVPADPNEWWPLTPHRRESRVALTVAAIALVVLSIGASALIVRSLNAELFSGDRIQSSRSASTIGTSGQGSDLERNLLDRPRAAVAEYAASLAAFKAAIVRPPGAVGINLDMAEARHRDDILAALVLDCIGAVNQYNNEAAALSPAQLAAGDLPAHVDWAVDCAAPQ